MLFSIGTFLENNFKDILTTIGGVVGGIFIGRKAKLLGEKKTAIETESISLNDKIVLTKYNKEEYEDLMTKYDALEAKYKKAIEMLLEVEREMNQWKIKYNVFKNMRTNDVDET